MIDLELEDILEEMQTDKERAVFVAIAFLSILVILIAAPLFSPQQDWFSFNSLSNFAFNLSIFSLPLAVSIIGMLLTFLLPEVDQGSARWIFHRSFNICLVIGVTALFFGVLSMSLMSISGVSSYKSYIVVVLLLIPHIYVLKLYQPDYYIGKDELEKRNEKKKPNFIYYNICPNCNTMLSDDELHKNGERPDLGYEYYECRNCGTFSGAPETNVEIQDSLYSRIKFKIKYKTKRLK